MNKAELIANVAEKTGFTKKDAEVAVNALVSSIEGALVEGDKVQLIGFGTFEVRERKARQGTQESLVRLLKYQHQKHLYLKQEKR